MLAHRKPLMEQWIKRLDEFLDLDRDVIGTIGGGRDRHTGAVDVAMVQSLARRGELARLLGNYGHVVIDECHHVPAVMTERVVRAAPARFVTGLTATPRRRDGHHPIITMQCGPLRHTIETGRHLAQPLSLRVVRRDTRFEAQRPPNEPHIQEVLAALAADEQRTEMIANDAIALATRGRNPIVLTERRDHLQRLAEHLGQNSHTLITLHGDMRPAERRAAQEQLVVADQGSGRVVLATGRYIGEGFDEPRLDAMLLAMPIAWHGTVVQYAGRLHRDRDGKHDVLVYDYVDGDVPVLRRMFAKRLRAYRSLGYELGAPEHAASAALALAHTSAAALSIAGVS